MSLESYREEAHDAFGQFLQHALTLESRWYGPMLPEDHPFSCCQLLNLTSEERDCFFEACGFVKRVGAEKKAVFQHKSFASFLSTDTFHSIQMETAGVKCCNYNKYVVIAVGRDKKQLLANFGKQETAYGKRLISPLEVEGKYRDGIKAMAQTLLALKKKESDNQAKEAQSSNKDKSSTNGCTSDDTNRMTNCKTSGALNSDCAETNGSTSDDTNRIMNGATSGAHNSDSCAETNGALDSDANGRKRPRDGMPNVTVLDCDGIPSTVLQENGRCLGSDDLASLLKRFTTKTVMVHFWRPLQLSTMG
jgi:hypothetical protein